MTYGQDVIDYNLKLAPEQRESAEALCQSIERGLPKAQGKLWHGHPVWFLEGNPIVGYSLKKKWPRGVVLEWAILQNGWLAGDWKIQGCSSTGAQ